MKIEVSGPIKNGQSKETGDIQDEDKKNKITA
jgi:hypothetical protein